MRKPLPSLATRTKEASPGGLPQEPPGEGPRPEIPSAPRPAERIRDALLRWLEEEM